MSATVPMAEQLSESLSLEERIRQRAYELYVHRANESASELDDWLQAEREILLAQEQHKEHRYPRGLTAMASTHRTARSSPTKASRTEKKQKDPLL